MDLMLDETTQKLAAAMVELSKGGVSPERMAEINALVKQSNSETKAKNQQLKKLREMLKSNTAV